jgi:hypothetical protein
MENFSKFFVTKEQVLDKIKGLEKLLKELRAATNNPSSFKEIAKKLQSGINETKYVVGHFQLSIDHIVQEFDVLKNRSRGRGNSSQIRI